MYIWKILFVYSFNNLYWYRLSSYVENILEIYLDSVKTGHH